MGRFSSSLTYTLSTVLALLLVSFGYSALKKYRLDGSSDETTSCLSPSGVTRRAPVDCVGHAGATWATDRHD
ncbi:MAG: hypothetical protein EBU11_01560 [Gammaproteobacteria bacterium]|nr:hypothetical protein [Gammaproteobacteria bacterium]